MTDATGLTLAVAQSEIRAASNLADAAPALPHLAAIDGLRAVAVLSVMLYHLRPALLPGGFIGVDIFFVISGFVVSGAVPRGETTLWRLLVTFYARRVTRILPALYLCLLVTAVLAALFIPAAWLSSQTEKTGLAAVLGYSNVVLARAEGDYFAPRAEYNMFTQTWSLGVEEQFYVVFPLLFLPWLNGRRAVSAASFASGLAFSLWFASSWSRTHGEIAFYMIMSRFWELALGVLAFQLASPKASGAFGRLAAAVSLACAAAIALALATTTPEHTPYPASLLPCCAVAILLALARQRAEHSGLRTLLASRPLVEIGRISYSLYLWHWPVFGLCRWTVGLENPLVASFALLVVFAVAAASTRFIEAPPRRALTSGRMSRRAALGAAACLVAATYVAQDTIWALRPLVSLSTVTQHHDDWYPDVNPRSIGGCAVHAVTTIQGGIRSLLFQRSGCSPAAASPRPLTVIGDSHAGAYGDLLARYTLRTGARVVLSSRTGCAALGPGPVGPECDSFLARALAGVPQGHPGEIVFLPGLRIARMSDEFVHFGLPYARAAMADARQNAWRDQSVAETIPALQRLVAGGAAIILEAPKPEFASPTFRCADWFDRGNPICADGHTIPRAAIEALRAPVMAQFAAIARAVPGVLVWDPLPLLCPGETCSAFEDGRPLFFDGDHLSGYANRRLEPAFEALLATLPN